MGRPKIDFESLELGKFYDLGWETMSDISSDKTSDRTGAGTFEYVEFITIQKMKNGTLYVFRPILSNLPELVFTEDGSFINGKGYLTEVKESEPRVIKNIKLAKSVLEEKAKEEFGDQSEKVVEFIEKL